jgi:Flp pilus assembly pilin Flp
MSALLSKLGGRVGRLAGQGIVEYALILIFVSVAAFIAMTALGTNLSQMYSTVTGTL